MTRQTIAERWARFSDGTLEFEDEREEALLKWIFVSGASAVLMYIHDASYGTDVKLMTDLVHEIDALLSVEDSKWSEKQ